MKNKIILTKNTFQASISFERSREQGLYSSRLRSRNICIVLFLLVALAACGGAPSQNSPLNVAVDWPPELEALDTESYQLKAFITDKEGVSLYEGELAKVDGGYQLGELSTRADVIRFSIIYPLDGVNIAVASAEKTVVSGGSELTISESDFTDLGGGDEDGDLVTNLNELFLDLDPFLSDTDGDSIPDGADIFPSSSAEWLDTDADGAGDNTDDDVDGDGILNDDELKLGTDPTKADTDGDGHNDLADNCALKSNADQADIDGDGRGNACDDDSDGDGLSDADETKQSTDKLKTDSDGDGLGDKYELDSGLNPLSIDTDGDGYNDKSDALPLDATEWQDADIDGVGDNGDNCPLAPNSDQKNTDAELSLSKGFAFVAPDNDGDACDDDIDGNGLPRVYVDSVRGNDANLGTFDSPVKSINKAVQLAYARSESLTVAAGNYDVAGVIFRTGVNLYGGHDGATFNNQSPDRDERSESVKYLTTLYNSSSSYTLDLHAGNGTFTVEGFKLTNSYDTERSSVVRLSDSTVVLRKNKIVGNPSAKFAVGLEAVGGTPKILANWIDPSGKDNATGSTGVSIDSSEATITNNIIKGGRGRHSTALKLKGSNAKVVNNTIDGSTNASAPSTSTGLIFEDSAPVIVNNIIVASGGDTHDVTGMKCLGATPASAEFSNNIFSTFSSGDSNAPIIDCMQNYIYSASFSFGTSAVSGNRIYSESLSSLLNSDYSLAGSEGVDLGVYPNVQKYGNVEQDYDGKSRTAGMVDIGAKEK